VSDHDFLVAELAWLQALVKRGNMGQIEISDSLKRELQLRIAAIQSQLGG
jgi:hypothetical protein